MTNATTTLQFLDMLNKAKVPSSSEHTDVTAFLRDVSQHRAAKEAARRPRRPRVKVERVPLFTKLSQGPAPQPGSKPLPPDHIPEPVYVPTSRPLPLSQLKGRRGIPGLDETMGFPFLRLGNPQSHRLGVALRIKRLKRESRIITMVKLEGEVARRAALEDTWEKLIRQAGAAERKTVTAPGLTEREDGMAWGDENGFQDAVAVAKADLQRKLNEQSADMIGRARAMLKLIQDETILALKEHAEREAGAIEQGPEEAKSKEWEAMERTPTAKKGSEPSKRKKKERAAREEPAEGIRSKEWAALEGAARRRSENKRTSKG